MSLLSIKKSTLNLKQSILRQAHRFSPTYIHKKKKNRFSPTQSSPKKHEHEKKQRLNRYEQPNQQEPPENTLSHKQSMRSPSSSSLQQLGLFGIFVIESKYFTTVYDEKSNRHEQKPFTLFNIILDDDDKQISLFRFDSDIIELELILKKQCGDVPSPPLFINTTNTSITTLTLTSSLVHNLTLRRLFTKSKPKKTNSESLELWLRSCASHPILGISTPLRKFLSPQRERDTIIAKPALSTLSRHQNLHNPATATTVEETPTNLSITLPTVQQNPTHHKEQHSPLSIHKLSTEKEYALSTPIDTPHYYDLNDPVLYLSSIASFCWDSIDGRSGTKYEMYIEDDNEKLEDTGSNCDNDDDDKNSNNRNSDNDDDIGLYELASFPPSPLSETLLELVDDSLPRSATTASSVTHPVPAHPLLMLSTKLACPPSVGQVKTDTQSRLSSTRPLLSASYQHIGTAKHPQQTCRMNLDDLQFLKVLGKGCMGKVILVRHRQSARLYALKAISKEWVITQREIDHTIMERNILSKVSRTHHPFLITLHHSFQNANQLFLVMDYHVGSDLATQLQLHYCFDSERCCFYIAEIVLGLQELHRLGILYRDLKPENILLAADGHIVLTDFGFSRLFDEDEENQPDSLASADDNTRQPYHTRTFCGTVEYMAAEMYLSEEYTFAVDYWSLGIILYEMLLGYTPFDADNDSELYRRVLEDPIDIPDNMALDTADLIRGLLERDPRDRLGCGQFYADFDSDSQSFQDQDDIRQHPYFYDLDWSDVYNKRLPAPFVPHLKSETDVSHFDPDFVKLSPRLSVPCRQDDFDDDDPCDVYPDSAAWTKTRYGDYGDYGDQQYLDDAFGGYSYINENTCVDTDSLLNEDIPQHHQHIIDRNSAPLTNVGTVSSSDHTLILEGYDHTLHHYHGSVCATVTTPATVTSTALVTTASTQYCHHHTTMSAQLPSSSSEPLPYSTNNHPISSSQQLGFTRFQHRHNQYYSNFFSSSLSLASIHQNGLDEYVWLY